MLTAICMGRPVDNYSYIFKMADVTKIEISLNVYCCFIICRQNEPKF